MEKLKKACRLFSISRCSRLKMKQKKLCSNATPQTENL